ncbi:protein MAIN-LIKE 2 [Lathyrus oleraceus]|uniref:protein MAIN-LIKE 2 n=1 Tax=Pisum sativum TaxID=3888 RepID=UPI0021D2C288|nr:protein MAIN-LIKE 2-like [Pisum sativum]
MATKAKGSSKLPTLCDLWSKLDEDFKALINNRIDNNGDGSSLLRLIPNRRVEISTYLLQEFMTLYEHRENDFYFQVCGQQRMNVTLEDVLFLTHLPIIGRPIVPIDNRDRDAFNRLFSENSSLLSLVTLRNICCDTNRNDDERIKAVLLMIVTCLIAPNGNGQNCKTSYVQFIEKLDEVNSYAWGAAMLAYLYQGMKGWKTDDKAIDGFTWLIMGFFFSHFRGLYSIFNNAVEENQAHDKPKLAYLIESLEKTGKIHPKKANIPLQLKVEVAS